MPQKTIIGQWRLSRKQDSATWQSLSTGEIQALFNALHQDKSVMGSRDAALIAVLYASRSTSSRSVLQL